MYGDVNVEVWSLFPLSQPAKCSLVKNRTYNAQKPFGTPLIVEIIESQWFSTSSRSNSDVDTTAKIVAEKTIPLSIIILILTMVRAFCL